MQISHCSCYVIMVHNLLDSQQVTAILNHQVRWRMPEKYMSAAGPTCTCISNCVLQRCDDTNVISYRIRAPTGDLKTHNLKVEKRRGAPLSATATRDHSF